MKRLTIFVVLSVASCATPYNSGRMGFTGGVDSQMITNNTARISARGNAYTDPARISDFLMLKSAETAKEHGFTHFAVVEAADASRVGVETTPGYSTTNVYGNSAFTTYSQGTTETYKKPGRDATVRFCKGACPGMMSADEVIANMGPRYYEKQG